MLTVTTNAVNVVIRTEVWITRKGRVSKAVIRDRKGRFLGATNQTKNVPVDFWAWMLSF